MAVAIAADYVEEIAAYVPPPLSASDIIAGLLSVIPMTAFANPSTQVAIDRARAWLAKADEEHGIVRSYPIVEAWLDAHPYTPREEP